MFREVIELCQNFPNVGTGRRRRTSNKNITDDVPIEKNTTLKPKTKKSSNKLQAPKQRPKLNIQTQQESQKIEEFEKLVQELVDIDQKYKLLVQHIGISVLYNIKQKCDDKGGIVYLCSIGECFKILEQSINIRRVSIDTFQSVINLIFTINIVRSNRLLPKKIYTLGQINFVRWQQLQSCRFKIGESLKYFNHDLTLFQEGAKALHINPQTFNLDFMGSHYSQQEIDIRIQNPCDYGFIVQKLANKQHTMKVKQYRFYQENRQMIDNQENFVHNKQLQEGQIFFGVNFQPADSFLDKQIKKYVKDTFLDYHANFDLMSYLDSEVPGCSSPQMYFKTKGCWTGGHQQNISMSALNINHGPDASQWYTLELKYIGGLRQQLKRQFGTDIFEQEGLWYEKLDWFIENGYPVKKFLQRKDDIVVSGPGTLHWVRSYGKALQSSWNIMPKTKEQIQAAFQRQSINKKIKFHKSNIIPLKSLILKYINHEYSTMSPNILQVCLKQVEKWLKQDKKDYHKSQKSLERYLTDLESFCHECYQQIFLYYAIGKNTEVILCLKCMDSQWDTYFPSDLDETTIYHKYQPSLIEKLMKKNASASDHLVPELCMGKHIGDVPCSSKIKLKSHKKTQINPLEELAKAISQKQSHKYEHIISNNEKLFSELCLEKLSEKNKTRHHKRPSRQQSQDQEPRRIRSRQKVRQKTNNNQKKQNTTSSPPIVIEPRQKLEIQGKQEDQI